MPGFKVSMEEISNEVLLKAAGGDVDSFEIIYKATASFVYNVASRVVYNAHDAEEVTQEVFLNVYRKLKYFRGQSSLKTWFYRIAVNCAINYSKKMARGRDRKKEYYENLDPWHTPYKATTGGGDHEEAIRAFLKILNRDQRMCVILRNIEGLSYEQIAKTLRININTVRSRLKRAREKLLAAGRKVIQDEL